MSIHSTALVNHDALLDKDVSIGPCSVIEAGVKIAAGVQIGSHCHLFPGVNLARGIKVYNGAVLGAEPQDMKYRGEESQVFIGRDSIIREYVTVSSGTAASGKTVIGEQCMIMAYSHVAHDCRLGDRVIIANGVQMGGHVTIGRLAVISGMTGIHQFTTIGTGAYIGGGLRVAKDILPFTRALGEPLTWAGVNEPALEKLGLDGDTALFLRRAFRKLNQEGRISFQQYLDEHASDSAGVKEAVAIIQDFLQIRKRGLLIRKYKPD